MPPEPRPALVGRICGEAGASGRVPKGARIAWYNRFVTMTQPAPAVADADAGVSIPLFRDGAWTSFPFDAYAQAQEEEWEKALTVLGFELWMSTDGMTGCQDLLPLSLRLWSRREAPRFVIEVNTVDAFDHACPPRWKYSPAGHRLFRASQWRG